MMTPIQRLFVSWIACGLAALVPVAEGVQRPSFDEISGAITTLENRRSPPADQYNALRELRDAGADARRAMPVILKITKDKTGDKYLRRLAIEAMAAIGEAGDGNAVAVLIEIISDTPREPDTDAAYLCGEAIHALRAFRSSPHGAVGVLARLVRTSTSDYLRREAAYVLGEMRGNPVQAIPALVWLVTHEPGHPQSQIEAVEAIAKYGFDAREASASLATILEESNPETLRNGVYAHIAQSFAAIAAEIGNRADLLNIWDLWRFCRNLGRGRRALLQHAGTAFGEQIETIDRATDRLRHERDVRPLPARCAFQFLQWRFYLALPWVVLALIWAAFCRWYPRGVYVADSFVDSIETPRKIWFMILPRKIRIGAFLSRVLLVHFFLRCPRVKAVARMQTKQTTIEPQPSPKGGPP